MSESSLHSQSQQATSAAVDAGLRAYMLRVYNLMALAVAFTGILSYLSISIPALAALALGPTRFVLFLGILGLGFMAPRLIFSQNSAMAQAAFWGYAALWGILIAPYFLIYTDTSIARSFFVTAGGIRRSQPVWIHHETQPSRAWRFLLDGVHRGVDRGASERLCVSIRWLPNPAGSWHCLVVLWHHCL